MEIWENSPFRADVSISGSPWLVRLRLSCRGQPIIAPRTRSASPLTRRVLRLWDFRTEGSCCSFPCNPVGLWAVCSQPEPPNLWHKCVNEWGRREARGIMSFFFFALVQAEQEVQESWKKGQKVTSLKPIRKWNKSEPHGTFFVQPALKKQ